MRPTEDLGAPSPLIWKSLGWLLWRFKDASTVCGIISNLPFQCFLSGGVAHRLLEILGSRIPRMADDARWWKWGVWPQWGKFLGGASASKTFSWSYAFLSPPVKCNLHIFALLWENFFDKLFACEFLSQSKPLRNVIWDVAKIFLKMVEIVLVRP